MGVAAYQRSSAAISRLIEDQYNEEHPREFEMMDLLNKKPKYPDCGKINEPVLFSFANGACWINVERKPDGFGYCYKSLSEAVRRWNVIIVGYDKGVWRAEPITA